MSRLSMPQCQQLTQEIFCYHCYQVSYQCHQFSYPNSSQRTLFIHGTKHECHNMMAYVYLTTLNFTFLEAIDLAKVLPENFIELYYIFYSICHPCLTSLSVHWTLFNLRSFLKCWGIIKRLRKIIFVSLKSLAWRVNAKSEKSLKIESLFKHIFCQIVSFIASKNTDYIFNSRNGFNDEAVLETCFLFRQLSFGQRLNLNNELTNDLQWKLSSIFGILALSQQCENSEFQSVHNTQQEGVIRVLAFELLGCFFLLFL